MLLIYQYNALNYIKFYNAYVSVGRGRNNLRIKTMENTYYVKKL